MARDIGGDEAPTLDMFLSLSGQCLRIVHNTTFENRITYIGTMPYMSDDIIDAWHEGE